MRKRFNWSWFGFLKIITLCLAIATGALTIPRDLMFLSGVKLDPQAALWAWVRVCFVISAVAVWLQQHKRIQDLERKLEPKIEIRNLRCRTWERSETDNGNECWIEIFNPSMGTSLELVQAEMISIKPDRYGYLPLPLHIKHEPTYKVREFSVNPGSFGMVDIITGPASRASGQQGLIIPHTIGGHDMMPPGEYVFTIRVSARDVPPAEATYMAWVGKEDGALKCVQL